MVFRSEAFTFQKYFRASIRYIKEREDKLYKFYPRFYMYSLLGF